MDSKQLIVSDIYIQPAGNHLPIPREKRGPDIGGYMHLGYVIDIDNDTLLVKSMLKGKKYKVLPYDRQFISTPCIGEFVELLPYITNYAGDYNIEPTKGVTVNNVVEIYRYKSIIDLYNNSVLNQSANPDTDKDPPKAEVDDNYNIVYKVNPGDTLITGRLGNGILFTYDESNPYTHIFNQALESSEDQYKPELRGIILENELIHIEEKEITIKGETYTLETEKEILFQGEKITLESDKVILSGDSQSAALGDKLNEFLGELLDLFDPSAAVPQDGGKIMMTIIQAKAKILKAKTIQTKQLLSKNVKLK